MKLFQRARVAGAGWLLAPLVFLATLVWYLATLTDVHTFDALDYTLAIERKPFAALLHPHHLAYGPFGRLVYWLAGVVGWGGDALLPLQVVNAVVGALGVALFCALVQHEVRRVDLALAGALLLGGSYAYWYYAVEVEVYTLAALFLVGCLWCLVRLLKAPSRTLWGTLGVVQGLAVLFHQTNVLLCVPAVLVLLLTNRRASSPYQEKAHIVGDALAYVGTLALVAGGPYLLMLAHWLLTGEPFGEFLTWLTLYTHMGMWGRPVSEQKWVNLGHGLANTLALPGGALLSLLLVGMVVLSLRHLFLHFPTLTTCLLAWLLTYGVFFFWWEPDNIEFWIACMPPFVLLVVLALAAGGRAWWPGVVLVLAMGTTAAAVNYATIARRGDATFDVHRRFAAEMARISRPGDFFIVPQQLQKLYLVRYGGRENVWSLPEVLTEHKRDWPGACAAIQQHIRETQEGGDAVFFDHGALYPPEPATDAAGVAVSPFIEPKFLAAFGLSSEAVTACFAPFQQEMEPLTGTIADGLPDYSYLPSAQERMQRIGWDFSWGRAGWRGVRISDEQFDGGWEFLPGVDPQLISPPVSLDLSEYEAVEMRIQATAATTATAKFEIFFLDEHGFVNADDSVERTLTRGETAETYRISIAGRDGWTGQATGFRLDPIGEGDGGRIRVEWFRLIPAAR